MSVYDEIREEREAQDRKWGGPAHDDEHTPIDWIRFIVDHVEVTAMGKGARSIVSICADRGVGSVALLEAA
jgi:hypothetical protein